MENGANVNDRDVLDRSALLLACQNGHLEVAQFLLENGADDSEDNNDSYTPLYAAIIERHFAIAKLLIERNSKSFKNKNLTISASIHGYLDMVKLLLEAGDNVDQRDNYGYTPIIYACKQNDIDLVRFLLEKGARVNDKANDGYTPILAASET